jgi:hypothetical protein
MAEIQRPKVLRVVNNTRKKTAARRSNREGNLAERFILLQE